MERLLTQNDSFDIAEPLDILTQEQIVQEMPPVTPSAKPQSYHSTPWGIVNNVLDIADTVTHGRAGLLQRLFSFVFFGGIAAVVNLIVFDTVFYHVPLAFVSTEIRNVIAFVLAAEISIMTNFIPNDRFTFRYLPGRNRSWAARCSRFHVTSIGGTILTFIIEFSLSSFVHINPTYAEAIALMLVLFYNFSFHHIFTYRHVKAA